MAAEPIIEPFVEPIVEPVVAPALELVPEWVPSPDRLMPYGTPLHPPQWSDVWDWVKENAILPEGRPIESPWASPDQVQQMIDANTGALLKAMSGFINQAVQLEVDNYNSLVQSIDVQAGARVSDFHLVQSQLRTITNHVRAIEAQMVPAILHELANVDQRAQWYAAHAENNAEAWATRNIFQPLEETIFHDKNAAIMREQQVRADAVQHANDLNNNLATRVLGEIAPVAGLAAGLAKWVDDCGAPMCETMGPKTDLGKALKALNLAATAALIASLAAMSKDDLGNLIESIAKLGGGILADLEHFLVGGEGHVGGALAGAGH